MRTIPLAAICLAVLALSACGGAGSHSSKLQVVAAENFWGSIAAQLGGSRVTVRSIIVNPATDPHSYEPTPSDARTMAGAKVAIVNGIGYDNWASQLIKSGSVSGQIVVSAGDVLGLHEGDNPHQWYSPPSVGRMVTAIVAAFDKADPAGSGVLRLQGARLRDEVARALQRSACGDPAALRRRARRLQREHLPAARDLLGLKLLTPYSSPSRSQRART